MVSQVGNAEWLVDWDSFRRETRQVGRKAKSNYRRRRAAQVKGTRGTLLRDKCQARHKNQRNGRAQLCFFFHSRSTSSLSRRVLMKNLSLNCCKTFLKSWLRNWKSSLALVWTTDFSNSLTTQDLNAILSIFLQYCLSFAEWEASYSLTGREGNTLKSYIYHGVLVNVLVVISQGCPYFRILALLLKNLNKLQYFYSMNLADRGSIGLQS